MVQILYNLVEAIYAPLIAMGPLYAIAGISITVSFMLSVAYKLFVNQAKSRYIKTELKELKSKMNAAKKKGSEKELKALFEKSMKLNNEQLMLNMKPLLVSMIMITLFLPWLSHAYGDITVPVKDNTGNYTYGNIHESFSVTQNSAAAVTFDNPDLGTVREGEEITIGKRTHTVTTEKKEDTIEKVKFSGYTADLPFTLPLFNKDTVGWLGLYIIISMPATVLFRKALKVE